MTDLELLDLAPSVRIGGSGGRHEVWLGRSSAPVSAGKPTWREPCKRGAHEGRGICDEVIGMLPFHADQSAACLAELDECMDACYDAGDGASGLDES